MRPPAGSRRQAPPGVRVSNKAFGRDKATRIILEAQFSYAPTTTWAAAAQKTVDAATALYGSTDAATVRAAFQARGIL